jgi:protein TonB
MKYLLSLIFLISLAISSSAQTTGKLDEGIIYPAFVGGQKGWDKYLKKNLKYPKEAKKQKIQGNVQLSFIVNIDGSLTEVKVHASSAELLNEAALEVVKASPNWIPATKLSAPIATEMAVEIKFRLR